VRHLWLLTSRKLCCCCFLSAVEDQLSLVTSSGRPFLLVDVRVVDEEGNDVAKDGQQVCWQGFAART
jgi:acyl-coenzyme A synthetase/AMP-(fatty) acid ligase